MVCHCSSSVVYRPILLPSVNTSVCVTVLVVEGEMLVLGDQRFVRMTPTGTLYTMDSDKWFPTRSAALLAGAVELQGVVNNLAKQVEQLRLEASRA